MDQTIDQPDTGDSPAPDESRSRRDLLLKGTVAAAVAAVAGTAASRSVSAADGGNLIIGASNSGSATTLLGGGTTFKVNNGYSNGEASIYGTSSGSTSSYGVRGDRTGTTEGGAGVFGVADGPNQDAVFGVASGANGSGVNGQWTGSSSTAGYGVFGTSSFGFGVYGAVSGTEQIAVRGDSNGEGGTGVYGSSSGSTASGYGVLGKATLGYGVFGESSDGTGVRGTSSAGTGVSGDGTDFDLRAVGSGRIGLVAAISPAPSWAATGSTGTIARDASGALWYCYAADRWQRLGGPTTAGAFVAVTPFRVYDSREPAPEPGRISAGENRLVAVKDARSLEDGSVTIANAVPIGASAVAFNVTVVNTAIRGFLYVADGGATEVGASTINWSSDGLVVANSAIVKISPSRQVKVFCGGLGSTDFIIDIAGYYL